MDTNILVMAAGESTRWNRDYPKQLAMVGNYTCIGRIAAQLQAYAPREKASSIIVARDNDIIDEWHRVSPFAFIHRPDPKNRFFIARGLLHTRELWGKKRTTILLGDVVYSKKAFLSIIGAKRSQSGDVRFWIGKGEIFALTFTWRAYDAMLDILRDVNEYASKLYGTVPIHTLGKLWHVYRLYNGLPIDSTMAQATPSAYVIDDYTMDLDTVEKYEKVKKDTVDSGVLEEPPDVSNP